jgi:hypothetical protein
VAGRVYGVWGPPTAYLIDRQGRLVGRIQGARDRSTPAAPQPSPCSGREDFSIAVAANLRTSSALSTTFKSGTRLAKRRQFSRRIASRLS